MDSLVKYGSPDRNKRNTKYKPNAGQFEETKWHRDSIFPSFNDYDLKVQKMLLLIIGKLVQSILEDHNRNSWFTKYEKPFNLELRLDGEVEFVFPIKAI